MNAPVESMEEFDNWCTEVIKQNFDQDIDGSSLNLEECIYFNCFSIFSGNFYQFSQVY